MADWLAAIILGLVEGLTEFIPVSSTGHLLLAKSALGLSNEPWDTFIVMIQLGAILAVVALYFGRLWKVLIGLPGKDPAARRFAITVLLAFFPSALIGLLFHDFIKTVLFNQVSVNIKPGERFLRVGGTIQPGDTVDGKTRVAADDPRVDKRSLSVPARNSSGRIMVPVVEVMQLFGKTVTVE
jgi:hypothetical protein